MVKHSHSRMVYLPGLLLLLFLVACSQGGPTSSPPTTSQPLVGTWTGCLFLGFNRVGFHADGIADLDNFVVHYKFGSAQVEFSSLPPYINGAVKYSAQLSSSGNLLTITDTQGNFCVMARSGSSGEQELLASLVGKWTGDCNMNNSQYTVEFHHITFLAGGTFTSDATFTFNFNGEGSNGTDMIPTTDSGVSDDYSTLGLTFENGAPEIFTWGISSDRNTLTLSVPEGGDVLCSFTRS